MYMHVHYLSEAYGEHPTWRAKVFQLLTLHLLRCFKKSLNKISIYVHYRNLKERIWNRGLVVDFENCEEKICYCRNKVERENWGL